MITLDGNNFILDVEDIAKGLRAVLYQLNDEAYEINPNLHVVLNTQITMVDVANHDIVATTNLQSATNHLVEETGKEQLLAFALFALTSGANAVNLEAEMKHNIKLIVDNGLISIEPLETPGTLQ